MKTRLILVAFIVLAQLGWLGANYIYHSIELAEAPRLLVQAKLSSDGWGYFWPTEAALEPGTPRLGKSIWWNMKGVAHHMGSDTTIPIAPRENPGDEMPEALELRLNLHGSVLLFRNGVQLQDDDAYLAAIWSKGSNGLWDFRLVAPNSPEDVLADGELRTKAIIAAWRCNGEDNGIILTLQPFKQKDDLFNDSSVVSYGLNSDMERVFQEWVKADPSADRIDRLEGTLEIALRKDMNPKATQLYYNGIPAVEGIRLMKQDAFPLPAEAPKKGESAPTPAEEKPAADAEAPAPTAEEPDSTEEPPPAAEEKPEPAPAPEAAPEPPSAAPETEQETPSAES